MKKKLASLLVAMAMVISFAIPLTAKADDITGIKLEAELRAVIKKGIMAGYGDGVYKPFNDVTRGEFANFVSRALELPEADPKFPDVEPGSKLAVGINSAASVGIVNGGTDGRFNPKAKITREQMAAMISNALSYLKIDTEYVEPKLTDFSKISSSLSRIAVAKNTTLGIIQGFPNNDGTYRFEPKKTATRAESAAFINRLLKVAEQAEDEGPGGSEEPSTPKPYEIATIENGELTYGNKSFETYSDAVNAYASSSTTVLTYNKQVIKMSSGLVIAKPAVGKYNANLYSDTGLKSAVTYVSRTNETELKYISSNSAYVKVSLGGKSYYMDQQDVYLEPTALIKGQNYYSVNSNSELVHSLYTPSTGKYSSYVVSKAPSFLVQGKKYYSWDGVNFYSSLTSSKAVGQAYPYFQFLPMRTKTNYTATELNARIDSELQRIENLYKSNPNVYARYKDATTISKIKGIGTYAKEIEATKKINALIIVSLAMHESDYGMSNYAQTKNNLFGLKVYDGIDPDDTLKYASVKECIDTLVNNFLNKNYIPPNAAYANGAVFGNKGVGANVKYASDAFWGDKAAGHMYRTDKAMGGKDYGKVKVGLTNSTGLNIRSSAGVTSTNKLFTYNKTGLPVAIINETKASDGYIWYKIISDDTRYADAYVRSDLVDVITNK